MVLQVAPDPGQVEEDGDPVPADLVRRTDAGEEQELRRVDGAAREDDLAPRPRRVQPPAPAELDPGGALAGEDDARCQRLHRNREIGPRQRRPQIGGGGAPAPAAMDRHVHRAKAFLLEAVHVRGEGIPRVLPGCDEGGEERVAHGAARDMQRAVAAAIGIAASGAGLGALEIGQHMRVGPLGKPIPRPAVVIERMAAHIDHGVERGRAAEHPAARPVHAPPVHMCLRFGLVGPVVRVAGEVVGQRRRHVNLPAAVARPGLDQEDARSGLGREPVGQHASRRPGADDDVVVGNLCAHRALTLLAGAHEALRDRYTDQILRLRSG